MITRLSLISMQCLCHYCISNAAYGVEILIYWVFKYSREQFKFISLYRWIYFTHEKIAIWLRSRSFITVNINFIVYSGKVETLRATSMLVTDVGDEMCWRQLWDVGDGFVRFCYQHSLSLNISVGYQQPKDVTNIENLTLTSKNCHQDKVTNILLSPTSM